MVISEAGNAANVVGLVYIAAFAPETGESVGSIGQVFPAPGALVMAVTQKAPLGKTAGDSATSPAWKSKPSWYQISSEDRMISPDNEKRMSSRTGARKVLTLRRQPRLPRLEADRGRRPYRRGCQDHRRLTHWAPACRNPPARRIQSMTSRRMRPATSS